jgi:hypothetical protein
MVNRSIGEQALLVDLYAILGAQFVSMYLLGSLAFGGFSPKTSDLDLLIVTIITVVTVVTSVTTDALADESVASRRNVHQRVERTTWPWATRIDAVYLPAGAPQEPMPTTDRFPTLEWHGVLALEPLEPDWPMQRYTLRELA